jgi:hypothetical protein
VIALPFFFSEDDMVWITTVEPADATGPLRPEYGKAIGRVGRLFNIAKIMGLNADHLRNSIGL